jgi:F-type H+-transporting ATPase subunit gamma
MSKLLEYRKRLNTICNIDKIIKAMQTVTIGKVRKSQQNLKISRSYCETLATIINENFDDVEPFNNVFDFGTSETYWRRKKAERVLLILFTASRSFSGDFTEKIFLKAREFCKLNSIEGPGYFAVGKKGAQIIKNKGLPTIPALPPAEIPNFADAQKLSADILSRFRNGEFSKIFYVYNRFKSILVQEPGVVQIFPYPEELRKKSRSDKWFFWEPSRQLVARNIFQQYLEVKTYQIYFESFASELAARMVNLRSASDSSQELIKILTIQINKARQARITEELTEIISSYEVIREEG